MDGTSQRLPDDPRGQRLGLFVRGDDEEPTFAGDEALPNLPVPSLAGTLARYVDSVAPHVDEDTLERVRHLAAVFKSGPGRQLQAALRRRGNEHRNWLQDWWAEQAYLRNRSPLLPYTSCAGIMPVPETVWPLGPDKGVKYLAVTMEFVLQFYLLIRDEKLRADRGRDGSRFCMEQFRRLFNTTRVPGPDMDSWRCTWHPRSDDEKLGPVPNHVVVLTHGHIFTLVPFDKTGRPFGAAEWELRLSQIWRKCESMPPGPGLGALTCARRDVWSQHRKWLINIGAGNAASLEEIETAMMSVVMDEASPRTESQATAMMLGGNLKDRWLDKSIALQSFRNGRVGVLVEHSPFDAMALVALSLFAMLGALEVGTDWEPCSEQVARRLPEPKHLQFQFDGILTQAIQATYVQARRLCDNLVCQRRHFLHYGKGFLRRIRMHPDAYVQAALQLAYLRLHRRPAPTYESSTTRQFYCGRTETVRSCTPEVIQWARAMDDPQVDKTTRRHLLVAALNKHQKLMEEAKNATGCDRHLLGLLLLASAEGKQVPELFRDPTWIASGGGGNFLLSTSLNGYTPMGGGCAPMCRHGYGVFYTIEEGKMAIFVSAWRDSSVTSVQHLHRQIERALLAMQRLVVSTASPL